MIIAQVTDTHLGFEVPHNETSNIVRFQDALRDMTEMRLPPDLLIVTGDLTEFGDINSYHAMAGCAETLPFPVYFAMGNHDKRDAFKQVFPDTQWAGEHLQYTIEDWPLRIIVLDTLEPEMHGGAFCDARAAWLDAELAKQPNRPTMIAMHHPPINTGIDWMTAKTDAPWVLRLGAVLKKYDNIVHIICGHVHRTIFKDFAGTTLSVSPAIALQLKLDLAAIDPDKPDDRPMIVHSQPGFCLHYWDGETVTTHTEHFPLAKTVVRFDEEHAYIVNLTRDEEH